MKIALTGLASIADQCASLHPDGGDLSVPATGQRRKVETIVGAQATTRSRVVVADDDVLLREGLASLLERSDFQVAGQAGNADELVELVRDERREILERLVAPGKLERRSRQALFGRTPPDDRRQRNQRRLDLPVQTATVENEHTGRPERQAVASTASDAIDSNELERAGLVLGPPLGPRGPGVAANPSDHGVHARREVIGRRERQDHVVLE